jgi:hypothetical protein
MKRVPEGRVKFAGHGATKRKRPRAFTQGRIIFVLTIDSSVRNRDSSIAVR